jgi:hypothetical protein
MLLCLHSYFTLNGSRPLASVAAPCSIAVTRQNWIAALKIRTDLRLRHCGHNLAQGLWPGRSGES